MSETTNPQAGEPQANEPTSDLAQLAQAAQDALTDSMVERLSITGANALEVVDRLNEEDTRDAILTLIDKVTEMHRSGALDTLFQLLGLVHGVRSALTDSMVERLSMFAETMVDNVANEEVAVMAGNARRAMEEAIEETAAKPMPSGGLLSTISLLSKPETQQALQFMLAFACNMRNRSVEQQVIPKQEG